jgi:hypothetical protein
MNILSEIIMHIIYTPMLLMLYIALYVNFRDIEILDISVKEMSAIFVTAFITPFLLRPLKYSKNRRRLGSAINNSPSYIFALLTYIFSITFRCVIFIASRSLTSLRLLFNYAKENNDENAKTQELMLTLNSKETKDEIEYSHHASEDAGKLFIEKLNLMIQTSREALKVYEGKIQLVGVCNLLLTSSILDSINIVLYLADTQIMGDPNLNSIKLEGSRRNIITWGCLLYSPHHTFLVHEDKPGWIYAYTFPVAGGTILGQGKNIDTLCGVPEKVFIKVGMTTQEDPIKRVDQQLGTSNPMPALLLFSGSVHACRRAEKALHLRLKDNHLEEGSTGREWFLVEAREMKKLLLDFCYSWNNNFKQEKF